MTRIAVALAGGLAMAAATDAATTHARLHRPPRGVQVRLTPIDVPPGDDDAARLPAVAGCGGNGAGPVCPSS